MNMNSNRKSPARYRINSALYGGVLLPLILLATSSYAADWPSWCGQPSHNMASENEKGLPEWYALGGKDFDPAAAKNIKWFVKLGDFTGGSPVVSHGRVFIGTRERRDDFLLCLDEQTGRELGRFICRPPTRHVEHWGVCSTPTVEGDRLYLVTPYGEMVCVNVASWLASQEKASAEESDRHIVWKYDMVANLPVEQDHTASCSPLVLGDFVYVCSGNERFKTTQRPFYPLTPSLLVFNKHTGQLVARDDEQIGEQLWRGQWSSPSVAVVNGQTQILFATGNGLCYGFEPVRPELQVAPDKWMTATLRGPIVYFLDVKGKDIAGLTPAQDAADGLAGAMAKAMAKGSHADKLALIKAHPDLAGRLALSKRLTADSTKEQAGAGLDRLSAQELHSFTELNDGYRAKFGFPFIIAVKGKSKQEIAAQFEARLQNDATTEFETALAQIDRIAELRLKEILP